MLQYGVSVQSVRQVEHEEKGEAKEEEDEEEENEDEEEEKATVHKKKRRRPKASAKHESLMEMEKRQQTHFDSIACCDIFRTVFRMAEEHPGLHWSFNQVLQAVDDGETAVRRFKSDEKQNLRSIGQGCTAGEGHVDDIVACKEGEVFDWQRALKFGHLLLPFVMAELSSTAESGITRVCSPLIHAKNNPNAEEAMTWICAVAWVRVNEENSTQVCQVLHGMTIEEGKDGMCFNKSCQPGSIATAIKQHGESPVNMCLGGRAIGVNRPLDVGSIVVACRRRRWAHVDADSSVQPGKTVAKALNDVREPAKAGQRHESVPIIHHGQLLSARLRKIVLGPEELLLVEPFSWRPSQWWLPYSQ